VDFTDCESTIPARRFGAGRCGFSKDRSTSERSAEYLLFAMDRTVDYPPLLFLDRPKKPAPRRGADARWAGEWSREGV